VQSKEQLATVGGGGYPDPTPAPGPRLLQTPLTEAQRAAAQREEARKSQAERAPAGLELARRQEVPKEEEKQVSGVRFCSLEQPEFEEEKPPVDEKQKAEIIAEVQRLKVAKNRAVEEEEFEEAAALKRRIKVLEDTLGEQVKYEEKQAAKEKKIREANKPPERPQPKLQSQMEHGESLWQMPSENLKLHDDEREFITRSKTAQMRKGVTDDTVNGVPSWAYKDALKDGITGVKTERPAELQYVFRGQIEDEKWEEGANFQASMVVQVPVEVAFGYVVSPGMGKPEDDEHKLQVGPGAHIYYHSSGTAQLTEMLGSEIVENEVVVFRIVVTKPKVKGKIKLEAAKTVTTREPFQQKPFYSFKSIWKLRSYPAGGTHVTRIIMDFKQYELMDFDALKSVSRAIDVENEGIRQSWSSTVALQPEKKLAVRGQDKSEAGGVLAKRAGVDGEMYSASFIVEAAADKVFNAMVTNELIFEYMDFLWDDAYKQLDDSRALIRQLNGIVHLVTSRVKGDQKHWMTMTVAHMAGNSVEDAKRVTTEKQVMRDPFYRLINDWLFIEQGEEETLVKRTMRDFKQTGHFEFADLAMVIAEAADAENRRIIEAFRSMRLQDGGSIPSRPAESISTRAAYAMRQMPEILDHAAKNNVLEVREMLEVKGADPNYIHIRRDSWAISDSRLEFFEEISPLIVAAEHGATEVMKVLFNHPQLDVNLCCCAFSDMEIYNYYTAYDMTISKKHPHAAALLRARGVLPASSEHVFKPPFDRVHGRPLRETVNSPYGDDDDYGEGEMPSWEVISQGNPALAEALHSVADTLSMTKAQSQSNRQKIFKGLITDWHPDRHAALGDVEIATKVFQWLQVVKSWYLQESTGPEMEQQPLPGYDDPDRPTAPAGATQYLHPSGSVFSVW